MAGITKYIYPIPAAFHLTASEPFFVSPSKQRVTKGGLKTFAYALRLVGAKAEGLLRECKMADYRREEKTWGKVFAVQISRN